MKVTIDKKVLINKFIAPVSNVAERCVISLYPDHIQTLVAPVDGNPILYAYVKTTCDLGDESEVTLNVPNLNRLKKILDCIPSEEIELDLDSNSIQYSSPNMRFKYHLLEDGVIEKAPVRVEKIKELQFNSDFVIDKSKVSEIMRATSLSVDTKKIYFYTKDGNVYAELTDRELANTDSISYLINTEFSGEEIKPQIIMDMEIFKMFYGLKQDIIAKVNTKTKVLMFKFEDTDYKLQYIVAPLKK